MKTEEVRSKTDSELRFDLNNMKRELFDLRIGGQIETSGNPGRIGELRRSIARVLTILGERSQGIRGQASR